MHDVVHTAFASPDLTREVDALRRDVAQLDRLLGDAVARLTRNFESIGSAVTPDPVAQTPHRGDDTVAKNVREAITALQFHDIASQLLHRVEERLDVIDLLGRVGPPRNHPIFTARRSQVSQTSLAAGTVELF